MPGWCDGHFVEGRAIALIYVGIAGAQSGVWEMRRSTNQKCSAEDGLLSASTSSFRSLASLFLSLGFGRDARRGCGTAKRTRTGAACALRTTTTRQRAIKMSVLTAYLRFVLSSRVPLRRTHFLSRRLTWPGVRPFGNRDGTSQSEKRGHPTLLHTIKRGR